MMKYFYISYTYATHAAKSRDLIGGPATDRRRLAGGCV